MLKKELTGVQRNVGEIYELKEDFLSESILSQQEDFILEVDRGDGNRNILLKRDRQNTWKLYFKPFCNKKYYVLIYTNIIEYDYVGCKWFFKFDLRDWAIVDFSEYSWWFTSRERNDILLEIRKNIFHISCERIIIRKDIERLTDPIFNIDGIDYEVAADWENLGNIKLRKIGIAENIPGMSPYVIATTKNGKNIYPGSFDYEDVQEIIPFNEEEYFEQFPYSEGFRIFWLIDSKKKKRGIVILEKDYMRVYSFYLNDEIIKLSLYARYVWDRHATKSMEIWRITSTNNKKSLLLKSSYYDLEREVSVDEITNF